MKGAKIKCGKRKNKIDPFDRGFLPVGFDAPAVLFYITGRQRLFPLLVVVTVLLRR